MGEFISGLLHGLFWFGMLALVVGGVIDMMRFSK